MQENHPKMIFIENRFQTYQESLRIGKNHRESLRINENQFQTYLRINFRLIQESLRIGENQ